MYTIISDNSENSCIIMQFFLVVFRYCSLFNIKRLLFKQGVVQKNNILLIIT